MGAGTGEPQQHKTLTLSHIHKPKYMKQTTCKNDKEEDLPKEIEGSQVGIYVIFDTRRDLVWI